MDSANTNRLGQRSRTSLCKCRSYCTTYNAWTRTYEGGRLLPRSTRDNHMKDDKRLSASQHARSRMLTLTQQSGRPSSFSMQVEQPHGLEESLAAQLVLTENELSWHSQQPFTSLSAPLVFIQQPQNSGPFYVDPEVTTLEPNTGIYALNERCQVNAVFLSSERRLHEIMTNLSNILCHAESANPSNPTSTPDLLDQACNLLMDMQRQKEYQWAQQRGRIHGIDGVFVNTGAFQSLDRPPLS